MWDEWEDNSVPEAEQSDQDAYLNFEFFSALSKPKVICELGLLLLCFFFGDVIVVESCVCFSQDYYKILEVDYDATDDAIRSNYIRLALVCSTVLPFLILYLLLCWLSY